MSPESGPTYEVSLDTHVSAGEVLNAILADPKLVSALYEAIRVKALRDSRNKGNLWKNPNRGGR